MKGAIFSVIRGSLLIAFCYVTQVRGQDFREERKLHNSKSMSNRELKDIAMLTDDKYFRHALDNILVPRIVGTPGHAKVREFIVDQFIQFGWTVELDEFKASTPTHGDLNFANIIARNDPAPARQLVLACHYDSKYIPNVEFLAATDSAVPCAMLLHLAKVLKPYLKNQTVGLTMIFFDGEEAFKDWSATDSLYGSRNLASKWSQQSYSRDGVSATEVERIDMLVLLDLIGEKNQQFYSFFRNTQHWHQLMSRIESKLRSLKILPANQPLHFVEKSTFMAIEDDHKPFLSRRVPVLHVFPVHFPSVWHTAGDNYDVLDFPSIDSLNKIFQVFVYAYLHGSTQ